MGDALRTGELTCSAARELTRVATPETERAWLDAARGQTMRQDAAATHMGQRASAETHVGQRASQTIPPAVRRQVMRRDNGRCIVNGCKHATFVDAHHLKPRSEGGRHEPDNLVCLCAPHHRAVRLSSEDSVLRPARRSRLGAPPPSFRAPTPKLDARVHADGTQYGGALLAGAADRNAQVFAALRGMGFKERECRTVLDRCAATLAANATREEVLRAALHVLSS
ncbi:MAG: HNH endonuclease [Myxococcota bacterium]